MANDDATWLPWLADAPMFIDGLQVASFYDAVLRPSFRTVQLELSAERSEQLEKSFGANVKAQLSTWFPWLKVEAGGEFTHATTTGEADTSGIVLQPIESASRQLVELALHYVLNNPDRLWYHEGEQWQLPASAAILGSPRMLAVIDCPPKTKFMPMAAELNDGRVVTFFGSLVDRFKTDGGTLPVRYPEETETNEGRQQRDAYWSWFADPSHWSANKAIQVIEDTIGSGGRPRWVDYRIPVGDDALHLHVAGRGEADTGVFAYNLVKRGWKHGVRLIGTLKSEPDLNVLAIYDK